MDNIFIYLLLYLNLLSLIVGYVVGRLYNNLAVTASGGVLNQKKQHNIVQPNNITIDDKKIVVDIDTRGLEKKYEKLGEVSQIESNIGDSISKLKNLKR